MKALLNFQILDFACWLCLSLFFSFLCKMFCCSFVYINICAELIRTVHAYRLEGGAEQVTEREYLFREHIDYEELRSPGIIFTRHGFDVSAHSEGMVNGVWDCIYVFDGGLAERPNMENIPQDLSIFRYCKSFVLLL